MFDPVTSALIGGAPALSGLDLESLPQRFTDAFSKIVAARVRLRGQLRAGEEGAALNALIDEMRRLAAAQEVLVATTPDREDRASAAFVAASAHQLCLLAEFGAEPRKSYIDAIRVAPEICATLLFLIADAQSDAAEMAKRIEVDENDPSAAALLASGIKALATGQLRKIGDVKPARSKGLNGPEAAVDALLRRLHKGVVTLAEHLLERPGSADAELGAGAQAIFREVKALAIAEIDDVFGPDGPIAVSVFPGPLHLANLLLAISGDLAEASLCRVLPPDGVPEEEWWQIIRRAARKRPYLWRNHRAAIEQGYLTPGVSAAISFPTGAGKSTLSELKIAATLLTGKTVVVLAPTLALVDQTAFTLGNAFKDYDVLRDLDDEVTFSDVLILPELIVTTPERCLLLQSMQPEAFQSVGLVVFDECHLLHPREADKSRRAIDAMLCILNLSTIAPDADMLMISAMMQNAAELAGWIAEVTGRTALALDLAWKPTRQARGCVTYSAERIKELEALLRSARAGARTKNAPKELREQLGAQPMGLFCLRQTWATKNRQDYALMALLDQTVPLAAATSPRGTWYLTPNSNRVATEIAIAATYDGFKTLTFVQSTIAAEACVKVFRGFRPDRTIPLTDEELKLRTLVEEEMGGAQYCYLVVDKGGCVVGGAASHHAQLIKPERQLHESLFKRRDGLDALFATSTLAQGMNLPSDLVLIAGDSRWDADADKMKLLEAHELLNAAGRAGRAGEGGQGFVLIVPSKVVDLDDDANRIDRHWMTLQGIFSQSDQCLVIDDPLTDLLDRIHMGAHDGEADYFLARLPVGEAGTPDGPGRAIIARSFAAYRMRKADNEEWVESRIKAALSRQSELRPATELNWLERVAASAGLPFEITESLANLVVAQPMDSDMGAWFRAIFEWIQANPAWLLQLIRPGDVEGLFGKEYKALGDDVARAEHALPVIRRMFDAWIAGKPLCELEIAAGTPPEKLKTCEVARHFAVRLTSDLAFVFGLPARILAARGAAAGEQIELPVAVATLARAVRRGCDSPESLANAVILTASVSRVAARQRLEAIRKWVKPGVPSESFEDTLERVRHAHGIASFDGA